MKLFLHKHKRLLSRDILMVIALSAFYISNSVQK